MFDKIEFKENISLKDLTSFKIGGKCKYYFCPKDQKELKTIIQECEKNKMRYFILGNGTNVLVDDKGFDGAVIHLKNFKDITLKKCGRLCFVTACSGVSLFKLNGFLLKSNITGLEWSYGIPGSVGGAVKMNAGAYDGSICDNLIEIKYLANGRIKTKKNFKGEYRKGFEEGIIISAKFKLKTGNMLEIEEKMKNNIALKKLIQPYDKASAGSIFKRNNDLCPSKIIDDLGLKGLRLGDAMISTKHAGFIVNLGKATSHEVLKLINLLEIIFKEYGYNFEKEIIYLK